MLPRSTVSDVLNGKRAPREDLLRAFVQALGAADDVAAWLDAQNRACEGRVTLRQVAQPPLSVTPSPALLSALVDVPMSEVGCFAELVDIVLAAHAASESAGAAAACISIDFDTGAEPRRRSSVVVRDNGPGMDRQALTGACAVAWASRAGQQWLGANFFIATARLGGHVTIRSTRADLPEWTVMTWDLRELARSGTWMVPVYTEAKTEADDHGTEITVTGLRELWRPQKGAALRKALGDLYSHPLTQRTLLMEVNARAVLPRRPCTWAPTRSIQRASREISAVQHIDVPLQPVPVCTGCRHVSPLGAEACAECGGRLALCVRRIWGWLGIQRYLHSTDYGIDFIRNGRKILFRDKSLFTWHNEDTYEYELEYPSDHHKGRMVGEVHCDHVPVSLTKDSFNRDSPEWRQVVRVMRGEGPLRPLHGRNLGYPINNSPLAVLFNGFRRCDPGLRYLVPGDGQRALHAVAGEWARHFRAGEPEFEHDDRWYQAAARHDALRRSGGGNAPPEEPDARDFPL